MTYLYLSTMPTDHINHFDVRSFFYWLINLVTGVQIIVEYAVKHSYDQLSPSSKFVELRLRELLFHNWLVDL